jgi:antibiotic biosynthesis monooxygenase (ABM) superfamily enzyme
LKRTAFSHGLETWLDDASPTRAPLWQHIQALLPTTISRARAITPDPRALTDR